MPAVTVAAEQLVTTARGSIQPHSLPLLGNAIPEPIILYLKYFLQILFYPLYFHVKLIVNFILKISRRQSHDAHDCYECHKSDAIAVRNFTRRRPSAVQTLLAGR